MATVRAFCALRYKEVGAETVAPPYDVISPAERNRLANQNPHNVVRLTLPEDGEERYMRAAAQLQQWLAAEVLASDLQPAFYRYQQRFQDPLTNRTLTRTGYFVALHTEPYERGIVLPHEHTFPGIKEDRFRLLQATRTHLESIFGLYEATFALQTALQNAPFEPLIYLEGEDLPEGFEHRLERVIEPAAVRAIEEAFQPVRIWIADGHHRYETALRFGLEYGSEGSPERFLPILLVPMDDPGLLILPTHRLLKSTPPGNPDEWRSRVERLFEVQESSSEKIIADLRSAARQGREGIGFVHLQGVWLLLPHPHLNLNTCMPAEASEVWKRLDVNLLHRVLLPALGYEEVEPVYTRSAQEVFSGVASGEFPAGFLLNPPSLESLRQIALGGEKMPHKSTYFYPKVLSGLIMWRMDDA